ncbi:conserved hypothetical protein [Magnetococcus marinus MC-1]|uniref:Bacteriophage-related protein n=1 Tax=Magnetococcus marinus (strain ATCC BAA-1437 / JCM 17883 / MC-1) TaxID=156889 RepID=A0LBC6_MAGMM|nr:DUF2924 domain-containing protein [Magnetococcus marinus]ABK45269.1 conserved hypothetical protein [Magnetococcus marinus MC-1]ABK45416.1 conserved hypothetical protein [Magnetococcus marinus MC-1]
MNVLAEIVALPKKPTKELNAMWRSYFNTDPPQAGKSYLVRRLAYRIQELAYGSIPEATNQLLDTLASATAEQATKNRSDTTSLTPGTRLIREWKGMEHFVTVLDRGFEYQGRKYRSLSAVAKAITGTHWSGPAFFGINGGK